MMQTLREKLRSAKAAAMDRRKVAFAEFSDLSKSGGNSAIISFR